MANLIYLYTTGGAPRTNSIPDWDCTKPTKDPFAQHAITDGMVKLFDELAKKGVVNNTIMAIDSVRYPGSLRISDKTILYVVPSMNCIKEFLAPEDIVIIRGGFKSWIPFLEYVQTRNRNWILFYRANTCHHTWPFWDIVLNDLIDEPKATRRRLHYNFSKPVNEDVFGPIDSPGQLPKIYDVMIGASHIHRKKGQYLAVQALMEYEKLYGKRLKAIMPGGYLTCSTNQIIWDAIKTNRVDIEVARGLTRQQLCLRMNQSKLFVHAGVGGQNDRGVLEAMCCGVPVLITSEKHFSPFVWRNALHATKDPASIAQGIYATHRISTQYSEYYPWLNGLREVAIPKMQKLINFITDNPVPNRESACRRFVCSP